MSKEAEKYFTKKHDLKGVESIMFIDCDENKITALDLTTSEFFESMQDYADEEKPKWISVNEGLPEITEDYHGHRRSKPVLCLFNDGHHEDCHLWEYVDEDGTDFWAYVRDGEYTEGVTHWMPLPEKPLNK